MTARTLLVFPPKFGLPSASPFSTKALILLEMAGLDYEARSGNPTKAPKRKLPVLIEDGKTIADSFFIRRHLEIRHGIDFDQGLSGPERAVATAMIALAEERFYFASMAERWLYPENQALLPQMMDDVPKPVRGLVTRLVIRSVRKALDGQGHGRHTREEGIVIGRTAIDAFAGQLGDKPFLMGDAPTGADASLYPMLMGSRAEPFQTGLREPIEAHANLVAYCTRMAERFPLPT